MAHVPLNEIDGALTGSDCWGYTSPAGKEYAIICTSSGTTFFDISNPGDPRSVGTIAGPQVFWRDVKTFGSYAYIVSEAGPQLQVVDLSSIDSGVVSLVNSIDDGGYIDSHNVAIDVDSGFLYRLGGGNNGLWIYDLNADPVSPPFVGSWTPYYVHDAQVVTYDSGPYTGREIAFCCSGLSGGFAATALRIVDVTDKANPTLLSTTMYPGGEYAHQGWLSGDRKFFYLDDEYDENPLPTTTWVIDVEDIDNPVVSNSFTNGDNATGHNMYEHNGLLYQANFASGLRVFDVGANATHPEEVAYFDTRPGDDSHFYNGLRSVYPFFDSKVIVGIDREKGMFLWYIGGPQLDIQISGGTPGFFDPSGTVFDVKFTEVGESTLVPGSPTLWYDDGSGFQSIQLTHNGGDDYTVALPPLTCGQAVDWFLAGEAPLGLTTTYPEAAPEKTILSVVAQSVATTHFFDMEADDGWKVGSQVPIAQNGTWERGNPVGSDAQPEDDYSSLGEDCWFTAQGVPGAPANSHDVDLGITTLLSPHIDVSNIESPVVSYHRWFFNDAGTFPGQDFLEIEIRDGNGSGWVSVEMVGSIKTDPVGEGGWYKNSFLVSEYVNTDSTIQVRFLAADVLGPTLVEAAIDDFRVEEVFCGPPIFESYCSPAIPNSTGGAGTMGAMGSPFVDDNTLVVSASGVPSNQFGILLTSQTQGSTPLAGGSQGTLCLGGTLARFGAASSGATGVLQQMVDLTALPFSPMVAVLPGETYHFQAWYRDLNPGPVSNFTDGISIQFQ